MNEKDSLTQYSELIPTLERFKTKLETLIQDLLENEGILYHVIESRTKSLNSFKGKLDKKGQKYQVPIDDITDLVGLRIILYYLEDVNKVNEIINNEFTIIPEHSSNKKNDLSPNEFGYLSIHDVIKLDAKRIKLTEWKKYKNIKAEVQIRTVLQHSWASISHILLYKKESDIPNSLKRKLNRLSGLLELADEQFQELKIEQAITLKKIGESITNLEFEIDVNSVSVRDFLENTDFIDKVKNELEKYLRFEQSSEIGDDDISQIVSLSDKLGFSTINDLNDCLTSSDVFMQKFFLNFYADELEESSTIGSLGHFLAVLLAGINFSRKNKMNFKFWSPPYWNEIRRTTDEISNVS